MSQIIPKARLEKWAWEKFNAKCSTVELMASVENPCDRAAIAIVALLDLAPEMRYLGMLPDEVQFVKSCHSYLDWLREELAQSSPASIGSG